MTATSPLISAQDLERQLAAVLVVDCRFVLNDAEAGHQDYLLGHLPGAVYASLDRDLSALSLKGLGRHPLPPAADIAATLAAWGWREGQQVVVYDAAGGAMAAARLWWMLRQLGIVVQVLDGGWQAWQQAGLAIETKTPEVAASEPASLTFDPNGQLDYEQLEQWRNTPANLIIDARGAARFRGEVEPIDPVAGHVPGALNRPFGTNLDATGRFKAADRLRREFTALMGDQAADTVVHMCGSGVTACHNLLAMEVAGLSGAKLFAPSWSGWVSQPRAVATGSEVG